MSIGMYVIGVALHPAQARVADKRLEEMVFDTARACLDSAGVQRRQMDHVTIAGCDELDGRSISSMLLAMPSGAYLKDELKATDSGLHGLCLEATRLASGRFHLGLVVSWCKSSTSPLEDVMRMRCDPFFTRPIGLNMSIADGLLAGASAHATGCTEAQAAAAAAACLRQASRNPRGIQAKAIGAEQLLATPYVAAPLRAGHQAPCTDGAVALLMASQSWVDAHPGVHPLARLSGIGWRVGTMQQVDDQSGRQGTITVVLQEPDGVGEPCTPSRTYTETVSKRSPSTWRSSRAVSRGVVQIPGGPWSSRRYSNG